MRRSGSKRNIYAQCISLADVYTYHKSNPNNNSANLHWLDMSYIGKHYELYILMLCGAARFVHIFAENIE